MLASLLYVKVLISALSLLTLHLRFVRKYIERGLKSYSTPSVKSPLLGLKLLFHSAFVQLSCENDSVRGREVAERGGSSQADGRERETDSSS